MSINYDEMIESFEKQKREKTKSLEKLKNELAKLNNKLENLKLKKENEELKAMLNLDKPTEEN